MHTIRIILSGLVLFTAMVAVGWLSNGSSGATYALYLFVPVWLVCSIINLCIGVVRAGYTVRQELPVLVVVFIVPVAIAIGAWMWLFKN